MISKKLNLDEQNSFIKCGLCAHFKRELNVDAETFTSVIGITLCNLQRNTYRSAMDKCKDFYLYDEVESRINKKGW